MSPTITDFNSLAETVSAIHTLRLKALRGADVRPEMAYALAAINEAPCLSVDDAMGLLNITRMLLDHLVLAYKERGDDPDATLVAGSWTFLDRAIRHFEAVLRNAAIENGVTLN